MRFQIHFQKLKFHLGQVITMFFFFELFFYNLLNGWRNSILSRQIFLRVIVIVSKSKCFINRGLLFF